MDDLTTLNQRRKVRKGTLSCWECKRRKVRCNLALKKDTCDGCRVRQTKCISQDLPDDVAKQDYNAQLNDRLERVEALLDRVMRKVDIDEGREDEYDSSNSRSVKTRHGTNARQTPRLTAFYRQDRPNTETTDANELKHLSDSLLQAWPSPHDLKAILHSRSGMNGLIHGAMCTPLAKVQWIYAGRIHETLQIPPLGTHPVLIAFKLLILATYIQSLSPKSTEALDDSNVDYRSLEMIAMETSRRHVTSNDRILESVEGIECLVILAMYYNNAGNLRSAWHTIQRAMLIAQLMGFHREGSLKSLRFLDEKTPDRIDPEFMWFRLMQMNRYTALLLGMLQGTPTNSFASSDVLNRCTPVERMQRLDCVAGGHILQRNEADLYDTATTHMIDSQLYESARCLPSAWWQIPNLQSCGDEGLESVEEILRVMDQLVHFHLITQLHLPYLLKRFEQHEYDHSKIMTVESCHEVLVRFTSLSSSHPFGYGCRGVILLAFVSCAAICLLHIDARRQRQNCSQNDCTLINLLAMRHQKDRQLMESTLSCVQRMDRECGYPMASKTAYLLDHLLAMEANATWFEHENKGLSIQQAQQMLGCGGGVSEDGKMLQIYIPTFGIVRLERDREPGSSLPGVGTDILDGTSFISLAA